MKHAHIEATFPELKGKYQYVTGRGEAPTLKPAISRAFRDVLKQVKGKRIHTIQAVISITTKDNPKPEGKAGVNAGLKCGECLMQHAEVVPLNLDGSCFCCNRGHRDQH